MGAIEPMFEARFEALRRKPFAAELPEFGDTADENGVKLPLQRGSCYSFPNSEIAPLQFLLSQLWIRLYWFLPFILGKVLFEKLHTSKFFIAH